MKCFDFFSSAHFSFLHNLSSKLSIYHSLGLHLLCVIRLKVILTALRMVWPADFSAEEIKVFKALKAQQPDTDVHHKGKCLNLYTP